MKKFLSAILLSSLLLSIYVLPVTLSEQLQTNDAVTNTDPDW